MSEPAGIPARHSCLRCYDGSMVTSGQMLTHGRILESFRAPAAWAWLRRTSCEGVDSKNVMN